MLGRPLDACALILATPQITPQAQAAEVKKWLALVRPHPNDVLAPWLPHTSKPFLAEVGYTPGARRSVEDSHWSGAVVGVDRHARRGPDPGPQQQS